MYLNKYFLELGCEEIPARFAPVFLKQLGELIEDKLKTAGFSTTNFSCKHFGTYRRLAFLITGLADAQKDHDYWVFGPPLTASKKDGNWSPAAQGFAKKQGVTVDLLTVKTDTKGREVLAVHIHKKGLGLIPFLQKLIPECIKELPLPIAMYWGDNQGPFFRPVQWVTSLLNNKLLPINIFNIEAGIITYSHRFLCKSKSSLGKAIELKKIDDYEKILNKAHVLVDVSSRKNQIKQILNIHKLDDYKLLIDELCWLCEWPQGLTIDFDVNFLSLPKEVLSATMVKHQKYMPCFDSAHKMISQARLITDNLNEHNKDILIQGNQAVLSARLNDARFFWKQDTKQPLESFNEKLQHVVYQKGAGTLACKIKRLKRMSEFMIPHLNFESYQNDILRCVALSKADLVTQMVFEFPELQGIMGSYYAHHSQESTAVVKGLKEQYLPKLENSTLPQSPAGTVLALADKFDLIAVSYHVGKIPTSSKDPLGIRRAMLGIARILLSTQTLVSIQELMNKACFILDSKPQHQTELYSFFSQRMIGFFTELGISKDIVLANKSQVLGPVFITYNRLLAIQKMQEQKPKQFKKIVQAATRCLRLSKTYKKPLIPLNMCKVSSTAEIQLKNHLNTVVLDLTWEQALNLEPIVSTYFDTVLVMDKDQDIQQHRLSLISHAASTFLHLGSLEGLS